MPDRPLRGHPTPLTDQSIARSVDPFGPPGHLLAVAVPHPLAGGARDDAVPAEAAEDGEALPAAGERDIPDPHRPWHSAAAPAIDGAAVQKSEVGDLVAVDDRERHASTMLGLAAVADRLVAADTNVRGPPVDAVRALLAGDKPRGPRLGLLVVRHEVEPAVAVDGAPEPEPSVALPEREGDLARASPAHDPAAPTERHVVARLTGAGGRAKGWIGAGRAREDEHARAAQAQHCELVHGLSLNARADVLAGQASLSRGRPGGTACP